MSWKRAVGTVAAQTGACGALLSLPDAVRDDVGVAPGVAAIYAAGSTTCYALRPAVAEGVAARVAWYGLFAGPVSGGLAMGVAAYAASLILPPTSPLPPEGQARLTAALELRELSSLAGARHLPAETVAHLWHEALGPFLSDLNCDPSACGPFAPAVKAVQARPAARDALLAATRDLGGSGGFEGLALALVAAERCVEGDLDACADIAWALGRAAPVAAPVIKRRATSVPTFAPALTYVGPRPGYKFTAGPRGVGYYLDYPAQPLPKSFAPVGDAPLCTTALHAAQLAWWVKEARSTNADAFGPQAAGLWRPTPRAIARVVLGGAALERSATQAPEVGAVACVEIGRAFGAKIGGDVVRPVDGAHLQLLEKIHGAPAAASVPAARTGEST